MLNLVPVIGIVDLDASLTGSGTAARTSLWFFFFI